MGRFVLVFILFVHGLIHLMGVAQEWKLADVKGFTARTLIPLSQSLSKISGLLWLVAALCFLGAGILILLKQEGWWRMALAAVLLSQALIVIYWPSAKWGTVANCIVLIAAVIAYGSWNFTKNVDATARSLLAATTGAKSEIVTKEMLQGLPYPVQLWLSNCGIIGKEKIHSIRLKQKALMRAKPNQRTWVEATAEQYITLDTPAFIWKVKMNMIPLLPVTGCDRFIDGKGRMNIKLLSLVNMVNQTDAKIDQGALQRFLGEIMWAPSAALLPYIKWEALDSLSAKATMTYNHTSGSVIFHFNTKGDIVYCTANRYMGGGEQATLEKWEGRTTAIGAINGIRMPVQSEVTWKLKGGDFTWFKFNITDMEYNRPQLYEHS